jgi:hypothetical protein
METSYFTASRNAKGGNRTKRNRTKHNQTRRINNAQRIIIRYKIEYKTPQNFGIMFSSILKSAFSNKQNYKVIGLIPEEIIISGNFEEINAIYNVPHNIIDKFSKSKEVSKIINKIMGNLDANMNKLVKEDSLHKNMAKYLMDSYIESVKVKDIMGIPILH